MSKDDISSFKRIGYQEKIPENADINNYTMLFIKKKDGKKITLYKLLSKQKEFNEIANFNRSWSTFNAYLIY